MTTPNDDDKGAIETIVDTLVGAICGDGVSLPIPTPNWGDTKDVTLTDDNGNTYSGTLTKD